jgi:inorganic triphosphatase YgiF
VAAQYLLAVGVTVPQEIELKLAVDPHDVRRLRDSPILRSPSLKHTAGQCLVSTYYDTPSFSLLRSGAILRVRKVGRERVQSVKMNAAESGGLARRIELESLIRSDRPNLMQIVDPDVRRLIQERCADNDLIPIFATDVVRETWLLQLGRSRIECAIDRGIIKADGRRAPICEVELELKSGQPLRLFQLAHRLNSIVPLRIEAASKAARGYDLANNAGLTAPTAAPVHIDPAMSVRDSFAAIARTCVTHVLASADYAYKSSDPEGVHELRISIRRMRAAFAVFRGAMPESYRFRIGDELRALQRKLGMAREWDVLVEETIASMPRRLRKQRSSEKLIQIAQTKRVEGYECAHAALRNPHYTDLLLRLASWIESQFGFGAPPTRERRWKPNVLVGPAPRFASEVMRAYHAKVRKLGKKIRKLDTVELHRLRIRVKKLRYATEFFGSIWPSRRTKRYLAVLKDLQQVLGALHDATVAEKLVAHLKTAGGGDAKFATAPVNHWLTNCQRRSRKEAIELWGRFANRKLFWENT